MKTLNSKQLGVSMIEILVSLAVVAFGLLGLAGLQARSMSFQKDSFDRKAATEAAIQLGERVMANYDGFRAGNYVQTMLPTDATPAAVPACGNAQNCTSAEVAARDWAMWRIDYRRRLATSGAYLEARQDANGRRIEFAVTLAWQEGQQTTANPDPICNVAPVNIADPTYRCATWIFHP